MNAKRMFQRYKWLSVSASLALAVGLLAFSMVLMGGLARAQGGPWLPLGGPTIAGSLVGGLAVHPTISGTLYTAVQPPGSGWEIPSTIYRSTDGAANWMAVYTASTRVASLAMTGNVIYVGAYNRDRSDPQPVIYCSTDGGLSWTTPLSIAYGTIWTLDVHPTLAQTAVAGGGDFPDKASLYQTTDSGATWTEIFSYTHPGWDSTVNAVLIHPTTPLTWLLSYDGEVNGTWGSYIYRSTDGGGAWTEVYSITEDIVANLIANPVTPTTLYASTWNDNFYRSADGGATWTAVIADGSAGEKLVLDPPNTLYAATGDEVRKSTDQGNSWSTVGHVPDDVRLLAIDLGPTPGALYAGSSKQGIYKSTDGGAGWEKRNEGIESLVTPCDMDVDPQDLNKMFTAADCDGGWMTADGGDTWSKPSGIAGCMAAFAINPGDPDIVYGGAYDCSRGAVLRSEDGGLNFEPVYTATFILPDCSGGNQVIFALAIAPSMTSTVYAAGEEDPNGRGAQAVVVRSLDDGASWTEVFTLPAESRIQALAIDPTDDDVAYAGGEDCRTGSCEGCIYRTTDGSNWTLVLTSTATVRSIVVDHQKPGVLYAAGDDYRVYKSTNSGDNWTVVRYPPWEGGGLSGNLLAIDPHVPSHVYLGGSGYIAETRDGGQTWSEGGDPINQGTPGIDPGALAVDNGTLTQTLYAGFSGVWVYSRPAPQPGGPVTVTAQASAPSAPARTTVIISGLAVDQHENWVADGTVMTFTTSPVGSFASSTITKTTMDGRASATLTGVMSGTATITVTAGMGMDTVNVDFTLFTIYLPVVRKSF